MRTRATNTILAWLICASASAMTFPDFDHMSNQDRQDFLILMMKSAERILDDLGRASDAAKVHSLFVDILPGDKMPLGEAELEANLAAARVADLERLAQNPNASRLRVEVALAVTLKKNDIELSPEFYRRFGQVTASFKPTHPK